MILSIVSGKGGAGKTTIAASIAHILPMEKTVLVDSDVDTPNLALALGLESPEETEEWWGGTVAEFSGGVPHPEACPFGAILPDGSVNELLCEGCGACARRYPEEYRMKRVHTADILYYRWGGVPLVTAELLPGRSGSGKIVEEIRRRAEAVAERESRDITLIDSAAGRGCPVIASLRGADAAILVVDNTPTGISDARFAADVIEHFNIPFAYIVNRADLAKDRVAKIDRIFGEERGGQKIGEIPFLRSVLRKYPPPYAEILPHIDTKWILKKI